MVKSENCTIKLWCEGVLQLSGIGTKKVMEVEFNHILVYAMVRLEN